MASQFEREALPRHGLGRWFHGLQPTQTTMADGVHPILIRVGVNPSTLLPTWSLLTLMPTPWERA